MKRIAITLLLLFAPIAEAQIKQITGGAYQNSNGVACAGCILSLQLPVDATVIGTGQIVPNLNSYQLDANGNVPANSNLWANDQLTPAGLTYKATLTNAGGGRIWGPEFLSISGPSPISLTQIIPVASSSVFFVAPALLNVANTFTALQTFTAGIADTAGTPASVGALRLGTADFIAWRNNANTADAQIGKSTVANGNIPIDTFGIGVNGGQQSGTESNFFVSNNSAASVTGIFRLGNTESIGWRNNANGADVLLNKNSNDQIQFNGNLIPYAGAPSTVAGLPTCNAGTQDTWRVVTDATAPTYNGTLTGGGAVRVPVYCNGSAWTSH